MDFIQNGVLTMKIKTLVGLSLPLVCLASSLAYADFKSPSGNVVCSRWSVLLCWYRES